MGRICWMLSSSRISHRYMCSFRKQGRCHSVGSNNEIRLSSQHKSRLLIFYSVWLHSESQTCEFYHHTAVPLPVISHTITGAIISGFGNLNYTERSPRLTWTFGPSRLLLLLLPARWKRPEERVGSLFAVPHSSRAQRIVKPEPESDSTTTSTSDSTEINNRCGAKHILLSWRCSLAWIRPNSGKRLPLRTEEGVVGVWGSERGGNSVLWDNYIQWQQIGVFWFVNNPPYLGFVESIYTTVRPEFSDFKLKVFFSI